MSSVSDQTSITIRISKTDKDLIQEAADLASLDLSDFIRTILLNRLRKARPFERLLSDAVSLFHRLQSDPSRIDDHKLQQVRDIIGQLIDLAKKE
ncbi:MAG: hypothetical protein ACI9KA_000228 [Parasphingorhabdus sp.]|jgi:hypothetical protein|uniref:DUF6290 family protein n=1 Tax=Parasphingorhabdus sp. TaxID=2709688 RepID=UPI0039E358A9|tara:strand:+ start:2908 stop:3192 length:285 start_codon:yes stop_codon:yes gene_type:complete